MNSRGYKDYHAGYREFYINPNSRPNTTYPVAKKKYRVKKPVYSFETIRELKNHQNSKTEIFNKFLDRKLFFKKSHKNIKRQTPKLINSNLDLLTKTLKSLLNKLTPTNFDSIRMKISEVFNEDVSINFSNLLLSKACIEVKYSETYAKLCKNLVDNFFYFKGSILAACQEVFFSKALNSDDSIENKKKKLGYVNFIGQLLNIKVITPKIILFCCEELLKKDTEESAEGVCYLMSTCNHLFSSSKYAHIAENFLNQLQNKSLSYSSRLKFLILDLIETKKVHTLLVVSNEEKPECLRR
jgi:MIF4G domain